MTIGRYSWVYIHAYSYTYIGRLPVCTGLETGRMDIEGFIEKAGETGFNGGNKHSIAIKNKSFNYSLKNTKKMYKTYTQVPLDYFTYSYEMYSNCCLTLLQYISCACKHDTATFGSQSN